MEQHKWIMDVIFKGARSLPHLMILVDDAGAFLPAINHSPWDGVTLADFVMPFFLFIVGVALALAYKRVPNKLEATRKAILRALKLFCVGLVLQGGFFHGVRSLTFGIDMEKIRLMGILQRIAIAYIVTALCEIWLKGDYDVDSGFDLLKRNRYQMFIGLIVMITYMGFLYGTYVPDWEYRISVPGSTEKYFFVKCSVRGDTGPGCNAVGMIDRKILGIQHLYGRPVYARSKQCSINSPQNGPLRPDAPSWCQAPFDPEGLLSSVMAIVTCLIGLQYGHVIVHFQKHKERIMKWLIPSFSMLILAFSLDFFGMHMNKPLYTVSYALATAGAAGLLFAGIYALVDMYGHRRPTAVMEWMGTHALMIYVLIACNILPIFIHGLYWREPKNNLLAGKKPNITKVQSASPTLAEEKQPDEKKQQLGVPDELQDGDRVHNKLGRGLRNKKASTSVAGPMWAK
uniref:Heparan-alpha-glucosaminide N-acetyltransferase catalytic domain-containing protein n=1 Tax=Oryza meridionalis TaxID=40149 RepID=A0A0E0DDM5_9ORYZ